MTFSVLFAVNVSEQRIIVFLTEKCCYSNLRSKVSTQVDVVNLLQSHVEFLDD